VFAEQAQGLLEAERISSSSRPRQDILEVKAAIFGTRQAFATTGRTVPIQTSVSLLPNGGKMLLGTDIDAVLTTLEALRVDVIGLNCSTGPEDMRDAIRFLGENASVPDPLHPERRPPAARAQRRDIFPEEPAPLAAALGEFVDRYGVNIVGGCCGRRRSTSARSPSASRSRSRAPARRPRPPRVSSMIAAEPLVQEPRPTIGRRARQLAGLAQGQGDAPGRRLRRLVQIAEDQVEGGAHVLDRLRRAHRAPGRGRADAPGRQARLAHPALPDPDRLDRARRHQHALEQIPGRAIVNSINLEAGRGQGQRRRPARRRARRRADRADHRRGRHGEDRRPQGRDRQAHHELCEGHGLDPELLIFDDLTFTLTTGEDEWKPSAIETIEGIRLIKQELPGVKTSLGVSNVSFGIGLPARQVLNSVFLHHCVEAGLDLAMVNPNHITPYGEISTEERELANDLVFNRREDALERFINHFEAKGAVPEAEVADPTAGMEPEEALHWHILRRKKDGVEAWIDRSVEKIGAVPTLNDVLLPAMKEVGDKFGAGELILPFVLQSAEVMKRAVAQLEQYLDKLEGYTKGTVVLATVFGDVHDIGKSLVNTILTNNGYTVVDLGKQVPIGTIIDAAKEHDATAIGLSALLVSTSKQMPACIQELHSQGLEYPVLIGGAAINRDFGSRVLFPNGRESDDIYTPGVFYCKDAFEGLAVMDQLVEDEARERLVATIRDDAAKLRAGGEVEEVLDTTDDSVRSAIATDVPVPEPPFWGVREIEVDRDELYSHLDTHVLFKLHWGGRGVKGEPGAS
jgi:5-methyltetrahydrofolate--homocysteine methyltransferase